MSKVKYDFVFPNGKSKTWERDNPEVFNRVKSLGDVISCVSGSGLRDDLVSDFIENLYDEHFTIIHEHIENLTGLERNQYEFPDLPEIEVVEGQERLWIPVDVLGR